MIALAFASLGLLALSVSAQYVLEYLNVKHVLTSNRRCGLNTAAKAAGKLYFGTAVDAGGLNDTQYASILRNSADFGQITPANAQKVCSDTISTQISVKLNG
jgi:hypothetical protein